MGDQVADRGDSRRVECDLRAVMNDWTGVQNDLRAVMNGWTRV
jgi:hypothetical protein